MRRNKKALVKVLASVMACTLLISSIPASASAAMPEEEVLLWTEEEPEEVIEEALEEESEEILEETLEEGSEEVREEALEEESEEILEETLEEGPEEVSEETSENQQEEILEVTTEYKLQSRISAGVEIQAETPQPKVYFDMESLEDSKLVNQVDGTKYDFSGHSGEQIDSVENRGKALKFDGSNYVNLGTSFQPKNAYTMAAWIKQDTGATDGQTIFGRGYSGKAADQLGMMITKTGTVYHMAAVSSGTSNSNYNEFQTSAVMEAGKWKHVAITRDGSNVIVYVNGEKVFEKTDFPADGFVEADKNMYIGMDCDKNGNLYGGHAFKGALDELRLYDTALTAEQVQELVENEETPGETPDEEPAETPQPKVYFDMESLEDGKLVNQVNGTKYDFSGNAGEQIDSVENRGKALKFDGSNYVNLGTSFQPKNAYTMAAWIKQDAGATDGQAIFGRGYSGNVADQLGMMITKTGTVYHMAAVSSGTSNTNSNYNEFQTSAVMEAGKWKHVAITRDGSNVIVYVNGVKIFEKTDFPADGFAEADKNMYIGMDCDRDGNLYGGHAFKGALDELRLYDTALTAEQVQELVENEETPGETPDEEPAETPQPKVYFNMESLQEGNLINQADGKSFVLGGNSGELRSSIGDNGKALKFDGTNYVDLGQMFQPENAYTMAAWIKQDAGATDGQTIFGRGYSGNVADQLGMMITKTGTVYHMAAVSSGTSNTNSNYNEFQTSAVMEAGKWKHVAITRDGSNVIVYVNGKNIFEKTNFPAAGFANTSKNMYIGMDCNGSGSLYDRHAFKGLLDELRLYDTALTQEQVQELAYVESPYSITEVSNGHLTMTLEGNVQQAPAQEDFILEFSVDGKKVETNITQYQYDETEKTAEFTFDPIINIRNIDKTVKLRTEYQGFVEEREFTLPAGNNESPVAAEVTIKNISPKLGEEPHVKGMLEAEYTYCDADNDAEGDTKYQWYISDAMDGEYTALQGINTKTVILLDKYVGKYLKCEVKAADINGNIGEGVMSPATTKPVQDTKGNPLTDWFYAAGFGISHHFLSNYFNLGHVYANEEEKWDRTQMTWDEFVGQFDAEAYAKQVRETGAKYVILTLGQNSGNYCAPNPVYDKYMREAGLLGEGEANPKTVSVENDLPMKMADALGKYGIKLMLYLPSNPPHSASWDESGTPNGYGYFSDYLVTTKVFQYTPGYDGVSTQEGKKRLAEMVEWWSEHYGDKIAGWWFDGMYYGGVFEEQLNMSNEYNISTLANAAKAGNPYSIITFNQGLNVNHAFAKSNDYQDFTAGESQGLNTFPVDGRWAANSDDCQNFMFGPLGNRNNWSAGWGCKGTSREVNFLVNAVNTAIEKKYVIGFDTKVNVHGELDPEQFEQLKAVKLAVWGLDTETLDEKLEDARELLADERYVEASKEALRKAVKQAEELLQNDGASQSEIYAAEDMLNAAIKGLKLQMYDTETKPETPKVDVDSNLDETKKNIADNIKLQISVDAESALKDSVKNIELKYQDAELVRKAMVEKGYLITGTDSVNVIVKPYLSMGIKDVVTEEGRKQVKVDIVMLYDVEVSVNGGTAVVIAEGEKIADSDCKTMEIIVELPNDIFSSEEVTAQGGIYVEHRKSNGSVYYHQAALTDGEGTNPDKIAFTNDKGYSEFVIQLGKIPSNPSSGGNGGSSTSNPVSNGKSESNTPTEIIIATPGTGDSANMWLPLFLLIAAAGVGIGTIYMKRKKNMN